MKVLLIEDSRLAAAMVQRGIELVPELELVGTVVDGHDVVRQVRRRKPEVIVLDLMIPNASGVRLVSVIREVSDAEIVVFSSWTGFEERMRLEGVRAFFSKNEVPELIECLRRLAEEADAPPTEGIRPDEEPSSKDGRG